MVKNFSPCLLAILEPMLPDRKRVALGLKLGYHCSVSNADQGGKVWLFFQNHLNAVKIMASNQMLIVSFVPPSQSAPISFSVVYAKCCKIQRRALWSEIENLSRLTQNAWAIAGDFNVVISTDERRGSRVVDSSSFVGNRFTWCNNKEGNARVWARLDRVLINSPWVSMFQLFRVEHLPQTNSNHAPLRLVLPAQTPPKETFGNVFRQIQIAEEELEGIDFRLQSGPSKVLSR
ncbi:uncharacterized protein LOC131220260 [Magnolia sinica]|uniref:uncharacterized protein LOC131220260 n=1 Tax=Magnolia sinica TaxID=86752 RepID=UPI0026584300|nr:uncharacterized protein LOC131220260 [Magnolia sinica]